MHDSFWFGYELPNFVFKDLNINSVSGLIVLCVLLAIFAIGLEGLKLLQTEAKLKSTLLSTRINPNLFNPQDNASLLGNIPDNIKRRQRMNYLIETGLYVGQVVLGYMLMLTVMTYNVYVSLGVLSGTALGYFVTGHLLREKQMKSTQLTAACRQCVNSDRRMSAEETVLDDDMSSAAGSSSVYVHPPPQEIGD